MDKEKVLQTVKKLLTLAQDNLNDQEGQTAMLQAQKLLAKYDLSMEDVEVGCNDEKEIVESDGTGWTRLTWWEKTLANIIADNFRCYAYMRAGGGKRKMVFLGLKRDVEIATEVYRFAINDIKFQARHYVSYKGIKDRKIQNAVKNDYINGYLQGLKLKFQEQVEKECLAPILTKSLKLVEHYSNLTMHTEKAGARTSLNDAQAFNQGFKDGKSFDNNSKESLTY